jgi:Fe-Mn family superoxide dismutase
MKNIENFIKEAIDDTFRKDSGESINEAYVTQASKFDLQTELLSQKTKKAHQELLEGYSKKLNEVSAKIDGCDKSGANLNSSEFRSLKIDETYNHNAAFLHGLYFQNISDLNSQINMNSLSYIKLARDFGTFDAWQEDFVACCLSARNGWAVTFFNPYLKRYVNTVIDLHSDNVMIGMIPVVVMDCWEHSYYRDYLSNRKAYVFGMMKELNWGVIEDRIKKSEKLSKIF